jgi:acetyl-CoA synthetase
MSWHIADDLDYESYDEACEKFVWNVPDRYDIIWDTVRKHQEQDATALYHAEPDGTRETYSFRDLDRLSTRFAKGLQELGIGRGDRVAVMVSQHPTNAIANLATWKLGAISVPVPMLLGSEMIAHRINDAELTAMVVEGTAYETVADLRENCPSLDHLIVVGEAESADDVYQFWNVTAEDGEGFSRADVGPDTPAFIMYTSGTTGQPKGVLHTHDFIAGAHSQVYMVSDRTMRGDDVVYWMAGDWNWVAGPIMVYAAWHSRRPFVSYPTDEFEPTDAFEILEEFDVTTPWLPPTALRMMRSVDDPASTYDLSLNVIISSGAAVTPEIVEWADREFGVNVTEAYGQTEFAPIMANCPGWFERRSGSLGRPIPGTTVTVLDPETGEPLPPGDVGEIAARRGANPAMFEEYWRRPEKTAEVRLGEWHLTGDLGRYDEDGYFYFESRKDDVIISSGYRIGPEEVEEAILDHDAVEDVGVIGVPDETRGTIVKAYVVPAPGVDGTDDLRAEIQDLVREDLGHYEYPREIEYLAELPKTPSGKVKRTELESLHEQTND